MTQVAISWANIIHAGRIWGWGWSGSAVGQNGVEMHLKAGLYGAREVWGPHGAEKLDIQELQERVSKSHACERGAPESRGAPSGGLPWGCPQRRMTPVTYVTLSSRSVPSDNVTQLPKPQGVPFSQNPKWNCSLELSRVWRSWLSQPLMHPHPAEERTTLNWIMNDVREGRKGLLNIGHVPRIKIIEGFDTLGLANV